MLEKQTLFLNNLDGIKNQHHELYYCHCSMEGHVSNKYARYITSFPYAFSIDELENKESVKIKCVSREMSNSHFKANTLL